MLSKHNENTAKKLCQRNFVFTKHSYKCSQSYYLRLSPFKSNTTSKWLNNIF